MQRRAYLSQFMKCQIKACASRKHLFYISISSSFQNNQMELAFEISFILNDAIFGPFVSETIGKLGAAFKAMPALFELKWPKMHAIN